MYWFLISGLDVGLCFSSDCHMIIIEYENMKGGDQVVLKIIKALGDENRLRLLNLYYEDELCGCEVEAILNMTQSNVSRHLAKLTGAGITTFRKDAKYIYYRLDQETLKENPLIGETIKALRKEQLYAEDLERFRKYRTNGLSCENIKENVLLFLGKA